MVLQCYMVLQNGHDPKNREKFFFSDMLEITQKHDFEAKFFLGLGGGSDHLQASQAIGQPGAQYRGQGRKIEKKNFSQKCWKSPRNMISRQKIFWVWGVGRPTYRPARLQASQGPSIQVMTQKIEKIFFSQKCRKSGAKYFQGLGTGLNHL